MYIISITVRMRSERRITVFRHPGYINTPLLRRPHIRRALIPAALPAEEGAPFSAHGPPSSDPGPTA